MAQGGHVRQPRLKLLPGNRVWVLVHEVSQRDGVRVGRLGARVLVGLLAARLVLDVGLDERLKRVAFDDLLLEVRDKVDPVLEFGVLGASCTICRYE